MRDRLTRAQPCAKERVWKLVAVLWTCAALGAFPACSGAPEEPVQQTFATPEEAVKALIEAAKSDSLENLLALLGPDGKELAATLTRPQHVPTARCSLSLPPRDGS